MPIMPDAALFASGSDDQADPNAGDRALSFGCTGRGEVKAPVHAGGFFFAEVVGAGPPLEVTTPNRA